MRETVSEITSQVPSASEGADINFATSILRVTYSGPARAKIAGAASKSLGGGLSGEVKPASDGSDSVSLQVEEEGEDGLLREYFDAYTDIAAQRKEDAELKEQQELDRAFRAMRRLSSE